MHTHVHTHTHTHTHTRTGTESSQSSDEGLLVSYHAAITRAVHKTDIGVPSQLVTVSHSAKDQAMTSTASSESDFSSSEVQALGDSGEEEKVGDQVTVFAAPRKIEKRPAQKVPKIPSKKLAKIKV